MRRWWNEHANPLGRRISHQGRDGADDVHRLRNAGLHFLPIPRSMPAMGICRGSCVNWRATAKYFWRRCIRIKRSTCAIRHRRCANANPPRAACPVACSHNCFADGNGVGYGAAAVPLAPTFGAQGRERGSHCRLPDPAGVAVGWRGSPGALLASLGAAGERRLETQFCLSNAKPRTSLRRLAQMQAARHFVERAFKDAKGACGMADYQSGQALAGWHHHMALVMVALMFLAKERIARQEFRLPKQNSILSASACDEI